MQAIQILWVDDEVDLLKPHFLFLQSRGYETHPCTNGQEALTLIKNQHFDVVLLDENMPGLNGLETLSLLKVEHPNLPVIMVTKNEEEHIMEEAIGSKISDYLIKPVNPNQILLSLKKTLDHQSLITEKTTFNYQKEFQKISLELMDINTFEDWGSFYKKLVFWELELQDLQDSSMSEIFENQLKEANSLFGKFIDQNYLNWIEQPESAPLLSHQVFKQKVFPRLKEENPTLLLVIDNLRWDQWKTIEPLITKHFQKEEEAILYSILPTATQYARNAFFAGLMPADIKQHYPQYWKDDHEEGGKNLHEEDLLTLQLERLHADFKANYIKVTNLKTAKSLSNVIQKHKQEVLLTVVYNFVDMISHAKSEMEIIKELASDNKGYRSLTESWFKNSPLLEALQTAQKENYNIILTTDHGTINVTSPLEVVGDKETSINLRYKTGRNLKYPKKKVFEINDPKAVKLPNLSLNSKFIFAKEANYFVYPQNYHHYANLFQNTYQHGGISMEEMLIPFVFLTPKK